MKPPLSCCLCLHVDNKFVRMGFGVFTIMLKRLIHNDTNYFSMWNYFFKYFVRNELDCEKHIKKTEIRGNRNDD